MDQMTKPSKTPNAFVRFVRHIYNPIGFKKGYNFIFFFITVGALFGFSLARASYLNFYGSYCSQMGGAAPGECYWYLKNPSGMQIHLFGVIIGSLLACFQFVPIIRYKALIFHRINGYLVLILILVGMAGSFMILRHAFGGDLATQSSLGASACMAIIALFLSYYNIKKLQIDQHRAWMLRAWAYLGMIITLRLIMIIQTVVITSQRNYYQGRPCAQIEFIDPELLHRYPECEPYVNGTNPQQYALVNANFGADATAIETGVALGVSFGSAAALALLIHVLLVELYLWLTPAEGERLRNVSYQKQLAAGMKRPGNAGLTVQKCGDANPWVSEDADTLPK